MNSSFSLSITPFHSADIYTKIYSKVIVFDESVKAFASSSIIVAIFTCSSAGLGFSSPSWFKLNSKSSRLSSTPSTKRPTKGLSALFIIYSWDSFRHSAFLKQFTMHCLLISSYSFFNTSIRSRMGIFTLKEWYLPCSGLIQKEKGEGGSPSTFHARNRENFIHQG